MKDEALAQMLQVVDEWQTATDHLTTLRDAARAVVAEMGTGTDALRALDDATRNAYPESDRDPDTVVPVEPRPFQVGDRVTVPNG